MDTSQPTITATNGIVASILHVDLVVQDMERALLLYTNTFGFQIVEDCVLETDIALFLSEGQARKMRLVFLRLKNQSTMVELVQLLDDAKRPLPASPALKLNWSLTFLVNNLENAKKALVAAGVRPVSEEYSIELPKLGRSRVLFCRDTEGYLIELVGPAKTVE